MSPLVTEGETQVFAKTATKRLDPSARAELILDQALRLFAERHYSVVTVRDIALACTIQNGLIYYYFENKDHLLRAALAHAIDKIRQTYSLSLGESREPIEDLATWLRLQVPMTPMLKSLSKVMADYAASSHRDATTDKLIKGFYDGEQALLESYLQRMASSGRCRQFSVSKVARLISLQIDGIFFSATSRSDDRIGQDIEDLCEIIALLMVE
jgi:AcrR family transcriptional regulator